MNIGFNYETVLFLFGLKACFSYTLVYITHGPNCEPFCHLVFQIFLSWEKQTKCIMFNLEYPNLCLKNYKKTT